MLRIIPIICLIHLTLIAQEEEARLWTNATDFSWVESQGNSESATIGLKNEFAWKKDHHALNFKITAVRAKSATLTYVASGSISDPTFTEFKDSRLTDERYGFKSSYERAFSEHKSWFVGLDWDRNEFAGIKSRTTISTGLSQTWIKVERKTWSTKLGAQYTDEDPVLEVAGIDSQYAAARANSAFMTKVGENSEFKQNIELIWNLNDTEDVRSDIEFAFAVNISARLALKTSLQLLYDRQPSFQSVDFIENDETIASVPYQLQEWDRALTTSLVVNF